MSAAPSSAPAAAASARAPFKKRPRHFWEGPDPTDAPVARLDRDTRKCVLGFLQLKDLSRVASVSHLWSAAVRFMKSIGASFDASLMSSPPLHLIAASSLAPHISKLGWCTLTSSDLFILSHHFSSLTSLSCTVEMAPSMRVYFGSMLQSLSLDFEGDEPDVPMINAAIAVISRLPSLVDLTLWLPEFYPRVNFAPLAAAPQLQTLALFCFGWPGQLTLQQLDQLRMLPHLRKMSAAVDGLGDLANLIRVPHSLQWQEIHRISEIDESAAAALSTLPTLTTLEARDCRSVAFLPSLTRLRTLALRMDRAVRLAADIVAGLSGCSQLTDLTLEAEDVTSNHMSQALSQMPVLRTLSLFHCSSLESLSFLSECAHLAQSLQSLSLYHCRDSAFHTTEIKHVLSLRNLTALSIGGAFAELLDACTRHLLQPPSLALPALKKLDYIFRV